MQHYKKTALGHIAIQQRQPILTAKQRRALLLIDSEDFKKLSPVEQTKVVTDDVLNILMKNRLIEDIRRPLGLHDAIQENTNPVTIHIIEPIEKNLEYTLKLEPIKKIMLSILGQYCGLLAYQLSDKIQQSHSPATLKTHLMQWTTLLQESNLSQEELQQYLRRINHELNQLMQA
jgi:hypothetical protein